MSRRTSSCLLRLPRTERSPERASGPCIIRRVAHDRSDVRPPGTRHDERGPSARVPRSGVSAAFAGFALAATLGFAGGCSRIGPAYPPRPVPSSGVPVTDVEPSRVTAHLVVTSAALTAALDQAVPKVGDGSFRLLGGDRRYDWRRDPLEITFSQGRIVIAVRVHATVALPLRSVEVPLDVHVEAEPVVTSEYAVKLQSVQARVTSDDARLAIAERLGG